MLTGTKLEDDFADRYGRSSTCSTTIDRIEAGIDRNEQVQRSAQAEQTAPKSGWSHSRANCVDLAIVLRDAVEEVIYGVLNGGLIDHRLLLQTVDAWRPRWCEDFRIFQSSQRSQTVAARRSGVLSRDVYVVIFCAEFAGSALNALLARPRGSLCVDR